MTRFFHLFAAIFFVAGSAALHAAEPTAPRDDAAWLQSKGTPLFHETFERDVLVWDEQQPQ